MTDESCKSLLEPLEVYGESPSVFTSYMRDETNIAIWRRGVSTSLQKYLDEIEHDSHFDSISDDYSENEVMI